MAHCRHVSLGDEALSGAEGGAAAAVQLALSMALPTERGMGERANEELLTGTQQWATDGSGRVYR